MARQKPAPDPSETGGIQQPRLPLDGLFDDPAETPPPTEPAADELASPEIDRDTPKGPADDVPWTVDDSELEVMPLEPEEPEPAVAADAEPVAAGIEEAPPEPAVEPAAPAAEAETAPAWPEKEVEDWPATPPDDDDFATSPEPPPAEDPDVPVTRKTGLRPVRPNGENRPKLGVAPRPAAAEASPASAAAPLPVEDEEVAVSAVRPVPGAPPKAQPAVEVPADATGSHAIGDLLKRAREERRLGLSDVAKTTHIRTDYIKMIEEGQAKALPVAPIYTRSYVKTLAKTYNLDPDDLVGRLKEDLEPAQAALTSQLVAGSATHIYEVETADGEQDADRTARLRRLGWIAGTVALIVLIVLLMLGIKSRLREETVTPQVPPITAEQLDKLIVPEIVAEPTELPVPSGP